MTRVSFYLLNSQDVQSRQQFACRLAEKAVRQGNKVMIATGNEAESRELDQLLWSFRPESFVPHVILGAGLTGLSCAYHLGERAPYRRGRGSSSSADSDGRSCTL